MLLVLPRPGLPGHRTGRLLWRLVLALLLCVALWGAGAWAGGRAWAADILGVDEAFKLGPTVSQGQLLLDFEVARGHYLYRERMHVVLHDAPRQAGVVLAEVSLPQGEIKHDPNFDQEMEVYHGPVSVRVRFGQRPQASQAVLKVDYQGCADAGLCYPPQTRWVRVALQPNGQVDQAELIDAEAAPLGAAPSTLPNTAPGAAAGGVDAQLRGALQSGRLSSVAGVFALAGLLLSFTPCVLPMLPILSSIIVGHGGAPGSGSRGRGFVLALAYALGMAMVYTALGVAAGLAGRGLAAALQTPAVLGAFAALLVALSLSMFGVYELQMPAALQTRLSAQSGRVRGGTALGAWVMGGLSALVVGPCVAAPLAGALIYISQTQNVLIGAVALFSMAMGMSVPLLLMGASAGALLPRAGAWMERVKTFFGLLLLGVAWWLVQPVLPPLWALLTLGALLALGAAFVGAFDALGATASVGHRAAKGLGLVLFVIAIAQIAGALMGADSAWRPLQPLIARVAGGAQAASVDRLPFRRITTPDQLDAELAAARGRLLMLDVYADWCVSCIEMERITFADPRVRQRLAEVVLVQADLTDNTEASAALLKRLGLFGPPGVIFFDAQGREIEAARVIGYLGPEVFMAQLDAAGVAVSPPAASASSATSSIPSTLRVANSRSAQPVGLKPWPVQPSNTHSWAGQVRISPLK